ncbi:hypothetical protein [Actinomadura rayongensis]|uniref:Uncharacterized protein n=1 Tax=Actinomadura rayongensis TaxID=1429076 RepID=A0A6I4WEQ6_9ACTN|nr:hypothetical protein [Actinomadura rayongensis]MXQ65012.1 hypothetical protein [Actinomadura rayongensis]
MRDIRISTEVAARLSAAHIRQLRDGPDPGVYQCCECSAPGDADAEPTSVVVYAYPGVVNVVFAHAWCSDSALTWKDDPSVRAGLERVHVLPLMFGSTGSAALMIAPYFPARTSDFQSNSQIRRWLEDGLHLVLSLDALLEEPPPTPGWKAWLVPGDSPGQTRLTIRSRLGSPHEPITVVDDIGIRVQGAWTRAVKATGKIALFAGLTEIHKLPDRDPMAIMDELAKAFQAGALTCGLIEADWIEL